MVLRGTGARRLHSAVDKLAFHSSRKNSSHTLSSFPIFRRTRLCSENSLKILAALLQQKDACTLGLAVEAREGPNTQDRARRLVVATGHLLNDVVATCHPPGFAGEVAETSSNTQCASRQLWKKYGVDFTSSVLTTSGDADTPWHPQFFSAVTFEFSFDRRQCTVVPFDGTMMFELASLVNQHLVTHHSTCTTSFTLPYHRLGQSWAADMSANVVL